MKIIPSERQGSLKYVSIEICHLSYMSFTNGEYPLPPQKKIKLINKATKKKLKLNKYK
jgi:hypothetical protein